MVAKILNEKIMPKISADELVRFTNRQLSNFSRIEKFFYVKPLVKVPLFVVTIFLLDFLINFLFSPESLLASSSSFILMLFLNIYLIFFIVFLIRHSFKSLLSAKNIGGLFFSYVVFMLCILLLFSSAYASVERMGKGYLTYGKCSDNFDYSMINSDQNISHNYFYFSAITLFTVGYGDICPMGWAKDVSLFNAFIGNFIIVVVMVLVISAYVKRTNI